MNSAAIQSKFTLASAWRAGQNRLPLGPAGRRRQGMDIKLYSVSMLLLAVSTAGYADKTEKSAKNAPSAPSREIATKTIRSAIIAKKFQGGVVQELMLTEPERSGAGFRYQAEFTVRRAGRLIRCEDWKFNLYERLTGWSADQTFPGRCND